jgi:PAS domain-containing protein
MSGGPGRAPPGPPVILGAFLAVWLFGRANLVEALLALLVCAVVAMVLSRARREAAEARASAEAANSRLHDLEFALRTTSRVSWTLDVLGRRIAHPEALTTLLGAVPTYEDAASPAPSFIHPEDAAEMRRAHARCLASGECGPLHLRFIRADGEVRWASSRACTRSRPISRSSRRRDRPSAI